MGFLFVSTMPVSATINYVPGCWNTNTFVTALTATTSEKMVTNSDMMRDPAGNIKTVAWSFNQGGFGMTPWAYGAVYVEDYSGHSYSISLPSSSLEPDVVLATTYDASISSYAYQVAFVYTDLRQNCYLEVWDLKDVGLPTFYATPSVFCPSRVILSSSCTGMPHIDMWSDLANVWNGYPTMHEFAVVWQDAGSGDLKYAVKDVSIAATTSGSSLISRSHCYAPDVACLTDVSTGDQFLELVYGDGAIASPNGSATAALTIAEYNYTSRSFSTGYPATLAPANLMFTPRIEAMNQYYSGASTVPTKWQVAYVKGTGGGVSDVIAYNDKISGPIAISSPTGMSSLGACVSAGSGNITTAYISTYFYHVGMFPWLGHEAYSVEIDSKLGIVPMSPSTYWYWGVNCNPITYNFDQFAALSLAASSNFGDDKMAAWYDGTNVMYVETGVMRPYIAPPHGGGAGSGASTANVSTI